MPGLSLIHIFCESVFITPFFDMPGTLRSNGVIKTLSQMDYIFTPLSADRFVVESTLKFVTMFRDRLMTTCLLYTSDDGNDRMKETVAAYTAPDRF